MKISFSALLPARRPFFDNKILFSIIYWRIGNGRYIQVQLAIMKKEYNSSESRAEKYLQASAFKKIYQLAFYHTDEKRYWIQRCF